MSLKPLFTSLRATWRTPKVLLEMLEVEFGPLWDPCPSYRELWDGLADPWQANVFVNPPYGPALPAWLSKGEREVNAGRVHLAVWLLPARTDTRWFHEIILPRSSEIRFLRGRLRFDDDKGRATFPSLISIWRRREER